MTDEKTPTCPDQFAREWAMAAVLTVGTLVNAMIAAKTIDAEPLSRLLDIFLSKAISDDTRMTPYGICLEALCTSVRANIPRDPNASPMH